MKRTVLVSLALATALVMPAFPQPAFGATPVFADEFGAAPLDTAAWAVKTPWNTRYTTGELEYYDPADVTFANGSMRLTSEKRSLNGYGYTSGIVTSLPRAKFSYGYFEMRAKLPKGQGIWPAFWLTNDQTHEIDVFELLGDDPTTVYMTYHRDHAEVYQSIYKGPDFSAGYHTFGVDWQPTYIRWYIDGVKRGEYTGANKADTMWIVANTAVGGSWPGSPDATTVFPQHYDIDYIRVFRNKADATAPAANTTPIAVADYYDSSQYGSLSMSAPGVLVNDRDPDGDKIAASVYAGASHGRVSMTASGSFYYTPKSDFTGIDTFMYRVWDGKTFSSPVHVTIDVKRAVRKPRLSTSRLSYQTYAARLR